MFTALVSVSQEMVLVVVVDGVDLYFPKIIILPPRLDFYDSAYQILLPLKAFPLPLVVIQKQAPLCNLCMITSPR